MIFNVPVYLLMVDIDPDVMNMFTQDYGLSAAELTRVTWHYSQFVFFVGCVIGRVFDVQKPVIRM